MTQLNSRLFRMLTRTLFTLTATNLFLQFGQLSFFLSQELTSEIQKILSHSEQLVHSWSTNSQQNEHSNSFAVSLYPLWVAWSGVSFFYNTSESSVKALFQSDDSLFIAMWILSRKDFVSIWASLRNSSLVLFPGVKLPPINWSSSEFRYINELTWFYAGMTSSLLSSWF